MKKKFLVLCLLPFVLTGCEKKPEIVEDYEVEAGDELSSEVSAYATFPEEVDASKYEVNLEGVDTSKIGTYDAKLVNTEKGKEYPFQITVVDTTYPNAEASAYTVTQPGTLKAADYLENVEDNTETSIGFLSFEKRADLKPMTNDEIEEDANNNSKDPEEVKFTEEMTFETEKEITEEGIYTSQIAVKDSADNMKVFTETFYIDGTGPDLPEHEDETIHINDVDGAFNPDLDDYYISDNFDDAEALTNNTTVDYELLDTYFNDDGKSVEEVKIIIDSKDRAGNTSQRTWVYTAINDYDYVGELSKLLGQTGTNTGNSGSSTTTNSGQATASDGFDRAKAEEEFALVNQKRSENGVAPLTWNEGLYNLACTRAKEISTKFSHERPDGSYPEYGENIAGNYKSTTNLINGWMNSQGHKANILDSDWTNGAMGCYFNGETYYWSNLFNW